MSSWCCAFEGGLLLLSVVTLSPYLQLHLRWKPAAVLTHRFVLCDFPGCPLHRISISQLSALKQELLSDGYMNADEQIRLFNNNKMPLKPGCDPIQVDGTPSWDGSLRRCGYLEYS